MKDHFINLINYDFWANQLIIKEIKDSTKPEKPVQLLAHLFAAQQIWLNRCKAEPAGGGALWPQGDVNTLAQLNESNHSAWTNFINDQSDDSFNKMISYQNSKGESFQNKLIDVLAHVINHGTHHRAQAGQLLKAEGRNLPVTDYVFYLRTLAG